MKIVSIVILAFGIIAIGNCFDLFDLLGGQQGGGEEQQYQKRSSTESVQRSTPAVCENYRCSDGTCAETPLKCKCPDGKRKCLTRDWMICVPSNTECPEGTVPEDPSIYRDEF